MHVLLWLEILALQRENTEYQCLTNERRFFLLVMTEFIYIESNAARFYAKHVPR